jgi:hypothetical protein
MGGMKMFIGSRKVTNVISIVLIIAMLAGMSLLSGCSSASGSGGDANYIKYVYPEKTNEILHNPGMGWVILEEPNYQGHLDIGNSGDFPEADYVSLSTSWAQVEKAEGVYDWSEIDKAIDYWTGKGKKVIMRLVTDTLQLSYTEYGTPKYLFDKYKLPYTERSNWGRTIKMPDIRNPLYLQKLEAFLNNMFTRFKDNRDVEVFELRGYGLWGEWHSGADFASYEDREKAIKNVVDLWYKACGETKLLVLCAAYEYDQAMVPYVATYDSYGQYIETQVYDKAFQYPYITFRCDSGGGLVRYESNGRAMNDIRRSGRRVPLLGEYGSSYQDTIDGKTGFDVDESLNDILFKFNPNYSTVMGWIAPEFRKYLDAEYASVEKGERLLGYRLNVEQASYPAYAAPGSDFTLGTMWSNTAVGRMWQEYNLTAYLLDSKGNVAAQFKDEAFDATQFISGSIYNWATTFKLPADLAEGEYKVAVALNDPSTGEPAIRLGITGNDGSLRYVLGTVKVQKDSQAVSRQNTYGPMTAEELKAFNFKANQGYMLTFKYKPGFDVKNFKFADMGGYYFKVSSEKGGKDADTGKLNWQDVSGEPGVQTIAFKTGDNSDYKASYGSDNFGDITISDITITELNGVYENFESGNVSTDSIMKILDDNVVRIADNKQAIEGKYSAYVRTKGKGDVDVMSTDPEKYALKASTTYTVSFRFKAWSDVGNGGYYYLNLNSADGKDKKNIGMWYERTETPTVTYTYTFRTGEGDGQNLAWGIHNGSSCIIDDISIMEQPEGGVIKAGEEKKAPRNTPRALNTEMPLKEGFEAGSFYGSYFLPGWNNNGHLTDNPAKVISGKWSLLGEPEYYMDWIEFANTNKDIVKLKPNGAYRLKFRYKITKLPEETDGFFYLLARSNTGGFDADRAFTRWTGKVGETGTKNIYMQLGDFDDYQILFGLYKYGGIVIDDVVIEEADSMEPFSGTVDFESGSMDTSYMTDGFRSGEGAIVTSDSSLVIGGKYSAFAYNQNNQEWYEYLYSDKTQIKLKANTTYTVSFDYKVIKSPASNGYFNFFARTESDTKADVGAITWTGRYGDTGRKEVTFKTGSYDDYQLSWGIHFSGAVVIDNIKIQKK